MLGKVYTSRQIRGGTACLAAGEPHLWTNGLQGCALAGVSSNVERHLLADKLHLPTHRRVMHAAEPAPDEPR
jgi:hypothetical protein